MSALGISMLIGVPIVCPSKTPERIWTVSVSLRCVTSALWPGTRRSRSGWMSASDSGSRGGQPSTTAPMAAPWDSPHVVTRKSCPQLLPIYVLSAMSNVVAKPAPLGVGVTSSWRPPERNRPSPSLLRRRPLRAYGGNANTRSVTASSK